MKRILLVDDSRLTLRIEESLLRQSYEIITATSGHEALEKAIECRPDMVLTDLNMPGLDGDGLRKALARDGRTNDIKVVIVTTEDGVRRLASDVDCFLKPFDGPSLREKVAASL